MKKLGYIFVFCLLSFSEAVFSPASAQDYVRLSERTIMGSARYVGMCGAMSAIGGDPSASYDNPAGLGLYRRMEVLLTMGGAFDRTCQEQTTNTVKRNTFEFPQASLVVGIPTYRSSGVFFHNFMFAYRQMNTFRRTYKANGAGDPSLGALLNSYGLTLDIPYSIDATNRSNTFSLFESGYVNEYTFDYAMNIQDQWYIGAGIRVHSYSLSADADYYEDFNAWNVDGKPYDIENESNLLFSGAGVNFALGLICRPAKWLRMGLSMQTPSLSTTRSYTAGTFSAMTDSLRFSYAPEIHSKYTDYKTPWRVSSSVAFQCGAYGMLSLQYDYAHASYQDDMHSLKAGLEIIPVMELYINAGYAYESTFKPTRPVALDPSFDRQDTYTLLPRSTQYASVALGYRGSYMMIQAAYQYRWQKMDLYAHEDADPYRMNTDTHRIVVTLGWHN